MKTTNTVHIENVVIVLIAFLITLLLPGVLIGGPAPSVEDVIDGKASPPTIENLTGGRVKNNDLIDKSNVDLVKGYLTAAMYESIKRGMVLKMGTQLPPEQLNTKAYWDATERNRGKAVMDKNGIVYYENIGNLWPGGQPFPRPTNGLEALANKVFGHSYDSFRILTDMWYVNSKGELYKSVGQEVLYVNCNARTLLPPLGAIPGNEKIFFKRISAATSPLEIKGLGQFSVRYYDYVKDYDTGFAYLPAFKRTIRVSATTWQDNIAGSDYTYGEGDGFQDPPSDWNLKLIGKKFLLVSEPKNPFPLYDDKGKLSKEVQFDVGKKFPRLGWVIWPVNVIEATPKIKNVYGKRVVYLPIWPYWYSGLEIVATDLYDQQMKLWKGFVTFYGRQHYLNGDRQKPQTPQSGTMVYDLQADHMSMMWMYVKLNEYISPDKINLGRLLQMGR